MYLSVGTSYIIEIFHKLCNKLSRQLKEQAKLIARKEKVEYVYLNNARNKKRGSHPGLVAILSCLELDNSFDIYRNNEREKIRVS